MRKIESQKPQPNAKALLTFNKPPLYTVFTPEKRLSAVNLADDKVKEGLNISVDYLKKIQQFCLANNLKLTVLLIPTKERVYYDSLLDNQLTETFKQLVANERLVDTQLKNMLKENSIVYVDTLPVLADAAKSQQIYPMNDDGHPNQNGYKLIAEAVADQIK